MLYFLPIHDYQSTSYLRYSYQYLLLRFLWNYFVTHGRTNRHNKTVFSKFLTMKTNPSCSRFMLTRGKFCVIAISVGKKFVFILWSEFEPCTTRTGRTLLFKTKTVVYFENVRCLNGFFYFSTLFTRYCTIVFYRAIGTSAVMTIRTSPRVTVDGLVDVICSQNTASEFSNFPETVVHEYYGVKIFSFIQ